MGYSDYIGTRAIQAVLLTASLSTAMSHAAEGLEHCTAVIQKLVINAGTRGIFMEVFEVDTLPGGDRVLRSRSTGVATQQRRPTAGHSQLFEQGYLRDITMAHPKSMARFGIRIPERGLVEYPDVESMNRKLAALGNDDPGIRLAWVRGKIEPRDYIEVWAQGGYPVSDSGPLHFHDTHLHMAGALVMPKAFYEHLRPLAMAILRLQSEGKEPQMLADFEHSIDVFSNDVAQSLTNKAVRLIQLRIGIEAYQSSHNFLVHQLGLKHPDLAKEFGLREISNAEVDAYRDHVVHMMSFDD